MFLAVLVGLYGWLMISDSIPVLGFAILAVLALAYRLFGGKFGFPSQLDFQVLMLLGLAGLSLVWVGNRELAIPKFYGLYLACFLLFHSHVHQTQSSIAFTSFGFDCHGACAFSFRFNQQSDAASLGFRSEFVGAIYPLAKLA